VAAADVPQRETVSVAIAISGERFPAALVELDALPAKPGEGSRPGDNVKPGDSAKPGDVAKQSASGTITP
jgi:hypothetical protein